jgi:hypothetical protein
MRKPNGVCFLFLVFKIVIPVSFTALLYENNAITKICMCSTFIKQKSKVVPLLN